MKKNYLLITNNEDVRSEFSEKINIAFIEGSHLDVFIEVRNKIHLNYRLITHPLAGSIKPDQTPYKSVIIEKGGTGLDNDSVIIIESAIAKYNTFDCCKTKEYSEGVLKDFRLIDKCLMESAAIDF